MSAFLWIQVPDGVMVAQLVLVQLVEVRVLVGQLFYPFCYGFKNEYFLS